MNKKNSDILRAIIGFGLGLILIFGAMKFSEKLKKNKAKPKIKVEKQVNKVYTQLVSNEAIPIVIQEKGSLEALKKVELYSEVQGILKAGNKLFKEGQTYAESDIMFSIDDGEFRASLVSQKSILYNLITQIMPDLKLDYPDVFSKWDEYLREFDIKRSTPTLPPFTTEKEKFFINSKNIVTTYYNIKNLEERHRKYNISAPFYGIVTEAFVNPGALIRPGQKLGTILSPSVYELAVSVNESYKQFIKVGKAVQVHNLERTKSWQGKIARIDGTVNRATQGIQIYVQLSGKDLKEGMFLVADIAGKSIPSGYEISRKLLVGNNQLYTVVDNKLKLIDAEIAFFKEQSAVITNLPDGTVLLQNAIPGAYEGMMVEEATATK